MEIVYLGEVEVDLLDGRDFYDQQQQGIGDYFVDTIIADTESLVLHAGIHSKQFGFFRMLGKTFPFAIYYLLEGDVISVCGVLDMRRDPAWIRTELTSRSEQEASIRTPDTLRVGSLMTIQASTQQSEHALGKA